METVVILFIVWLAIAMAVAVIAREKGRSPARWFLVGLLLPLFGLIIVIKVPRTVDRGTGPATRTMRAGRQVARGRSQHSAGRADHGFVADSGRFVTDGYTCKFCGKRLQGLGEICRGCVAAGHPACAVCGRVRAEHP